MRIKNDGQVITFYSFKGGVGRTMALANVAFLAALNGQRVLVMDWDLEAPGLAYYFRGLLDSAGAKSLTQAPGILDFVWDWASTIQTATSEATVASLQKKYSSGDGFTNAVRNIPCSQGGVEYTLDFIGAGGRNICTPEEISYEDALARFSWASFFENTAGGFLLESLRKWAKSNYDLVLIDSRTGLADVAGICTVQMPDVVAMCFILNRQNIDGIAKVSAAVRAKRANEVRVRAVPMRVARSGTSEESDARARAITDLTRIGGFSSEEIQEDFRLMPIAAAENVPFYETLAPFCAADPKYDPLTLNYLRLANQFVKQEMEMPAFDPELLELAVRRLAPRNATVEYVAKLTSVEPARAVSEVRRLLNSALDSEVDDNGLEEDYVMLLVDVAFAISETIAEYADAVDLRTMGLELLRTYLPGNPEKWRGILVSLLQRHIEGIGPGLEFEEAQQLEDEIDTLLSLDPTVANQLRRINFRRSLARRYIIVGNTEAARQVVGEYLLIASELDRIKGSLAPDQIDELTAAQIDASIISGNIQEHNAALDRALRDYEHGLAELLSDGGDLGRVEQQKLRHELHFRLASVLFRMNRKLAAGQHAVEALMWSQNSAQLAVRFLDLAKFATSAAEADAKVVNDFCRILASWVDSKKFHLVAYNGRITKNAIEFLEVLLEMGVILTSNADFERNVVEQILDLADSLVATILRRRKTIGERHGVEISEMAKKLLEIAKISKLAVNDYSALADAFESFRSRKTRSSGANE